jgi:hypothetical protein
MDVSAIGIPLAFLALMVVLCWWVVGAKGHWTLKIAVVAVSLGVSLILWNSVSSLSGWASKQELPERFLVHWAVIHEPSRDGKGGDGGIYIWVTELDDNHEMKKNQSAVFTPNRPDEPRAYKLPYSRKLHEQLTQAMGKLRQGKPVVGRRDGIEGDGEDGDGDGEEGKEKGKGKNKGSFSKKQKFMFYDLPPPKLPDKIPGQ